MALAPVHCLSHGTTAILGERSNIAEYWKKCGDEAIKHQFKGLVIMGAHWDVDGEGIEVATNPDPRVEPPALVARSKWQDYKPNPDLVSSKRIIDMLRTGGVQVSEAPIYDWKIDVFPCIRRMFPDECPPTVILSQNSHFNPHFHARIGALLRPLRKEGYLFIGSGGGVHNLYRADWSMQTKYRDTFAQAAPPDATHLEFRQALEDVIVRNGGGPRLKRGLIRLMKHPNYRDAHGSDDHFMAQCFVAGLVGDPEDIGTKGKLAAECWELRNQCETQFTLGEWE